MTKPKHEMLDWSKSFMYNIHQTHFLIEKYLEHKLAQKKCISFSQFLVLLPLLCIPKASQADIAEVLFLTEATVSRHMRTLTEDHLVTRKEDPDNRRKHILTMTVRGHKEFTKAQNVIELALDEAFLNISPKERIVVTRVFDQVTAHLLKKI